MTVNRELLIHKCNIKLGIRGPLLNRITDYLHRWSQRTIRVNIISIGRRARQVFLKALFRVRF